jgi:DNA-binding transcriptional regulator YdaS (Cro superfamily)
MKQKFQDKLQEWAKPIGGIRSLAADLEISPQAVYLWKQIPASRLIDVEKITGVSRRDLRPDLYKGL